MNKRTRRQLLTGTRAASDETVLGAALAVEQLVVFCYEYVLAHAALAPRTSSVARQFLGQERAHVRSLTTWVRERGGTPPAPPPDVTSAQRTLDARDFGQRLLDVHTDHDGIDFLFGLEGLAEGAYYVAVSKLQDRALVQSAAQTMATEGQHAAILGLLKHPHDPARAVPVAFVEGQH